MAVSRFEPWPISLPKPSPSGGDLREIGERFGRAERRFDAELLLLQHAHLVELHDGADRGAEGDRVEAVLVADEVGVGQRFEVVDAVGGAQRPRRLVFEAARGAPVLRLVDHREVGLVDLGDAAARDRAAEAGLVGHEVRLAVGLARLVHRFGRNVLRAFELDIAMVARRQRADFVDHVHQHLRAELGQALPGHRVIGQDLLGGGGCLHEGLEIADIAHALGAAHGNRLEILAAHHRADARASRGAMQVVDHPRVQAARLAGAPDRADADLRILMLGLDRGLGLPDRLAPEPAGIEQLRSVVLDEQIDRLGRLALEDDHVPTGHLQLGAPIAARVGAGDRAGQRPLGDDRVAPARRSHRSGERSRGPDHLVRGRQRIDLRIDFLGEVFGRQAALAEVITRPLHVEGLRRASSLGEIDAQDFSSPSHDRPPYACGWLPTLLGPQLHALEPGPVGVDIGDCTGRAGRSAGGIAAAQVALLHLPGVLHVIDRSERTGDRADLAAHAHVVEHDLGAGSGIDLDRVDRTRMQAPGLVALGAGIGNLPPGIFEVEDLDARLRGIEYAVVLVAARHFALQAAGTFVGVDIQGLLHVSSWNAQWRTTSMTLPPVAASVNRERASWQPPVATKAVWLAPQLDLRLNSTNASISRLGSFISFSFQGPRWRRV